MAHEYTGKFTSGGDAFKLTSVYTNMKTLVERAWRYDVWNCQIAARAGKLTPGEHIHMIDGGPKMSLQQIDDAIAQLTMTREQLQKVA